VLVSVPNWPTVSETHSTVCTNGASLLLRRNTRCRLPSNSRLNRTGAPGSVGQRGFVCFALPDVH